MKKLWINTVLIVVILIAGAQVVRKLKGMNDTADGASVEVESEDVRREIDQQALIEYSKNLDWSSVVPIQAEADQYTKPSSTVSGRMGFPYLCFLPRGYGEEPGRTYPLILFLHGAGSKGSDLSKLRNHTPLEYLERADDSHFIYVSPQCPEGGGWSSNELHRFLQKVLEAYPIDEKRVYLTGISMGGHGSWALAEDFPHSFAAVVVLCGAGDPVLARARLRHTPIWIVHGELDTVVPVSRAWEMINALEPVNPDLMYTIFPNVDHGGVAGVYQRISFYAWLLQHRRG
ncbi:MAG: prolyl oligopeptidase family serine peptidase [bacterium]|nr:prolyl oligopeptidase family serine peptidase [bacterium]